MSGQLKPTSVLSAWIELDWQQSGSIQIHSLLLNRLSNCSRNFFESQKKFFFAFGSNRTKIELKIFDFCFFLKKCVQAGFQYFLKIMFCSKKIFGQGFMKIVPSLKLARNFFSTNFENLRFWKKIKFCSLRKKNSCSWRYIKLFWGTVENMHFCKNKNAPKCHKSKIEPFI